MTFVNWIGRFGIEKSYCVCCLQMELVWTVMRGLLMQAVLLV